MLTLGMPFILEERRKIAAKVRSLVRVLHLSYQPLFYTRDVSTLITDNILSNEPSHTKQVSALRICYCGSNNRLKPKDEACTH